VTRASDRPGDRSADEVDAVIAQWAGERPDVDPASIGIFGRLARVHLVEQSVVRRLHERHGLTPAAFDVLSSLRRSGSPYRRTTGELAESSLLTSAAMTFRIDKLATEGLVTRVRSPEDRRVVYAELTAAGLEKIDAVYEEHIALENAMLGGLNLPERQHLAELLRRLSRSVAGVGQSPPAAT
jgi:DNA-binding MarR family transcriptional regulator